MSRFYWGVPIPESWGVKQIKSTAGVTLGKMLQAADSGGDLQSPYLRAANVQPDGLLDLSDVKKMWFGPRELLQLDLRRGDVVVVEGGVGGYARAAFINRNLPGVGFQNSIIRLRPRGSDGRFLAYYLVAARSKGYLQAHCNIVSMPHFTAEKLAALRMPVPPLGEQIAIASYLDRETARIDEVIGKQEQLIVRLKERREALISRVVAGKMTPGRRRQSGIPEYGEVPENWTSVPLKSVISYQEGPGIMAEDFRDAGIPLLRVASVRGRRASLEGCNYLDPVAVVSRWRRFRVAEGDLLISASASMGTVSEVGEDVVGAIPYTGIIKLRPKGMIKSFIRWFVVSAPFVQQVDQMKSGSTIQHFGPTHLSRMRVALPPVTEQMRLSRFLDSQAAKIDLLVAKAEQFITLAKERRSALITAAVTGQIDVREAS